MSKEGGIDAFCFPCFLFFITMSLVIMAFAAEGKQAGQFLVAMGEPVSPALAAYKPSSPQNRKQLKRTPTAPSIKAASTTWCIVKPSTTQDQLDNIIQYVCNEGSVDCTLIQQRGQCYFPANKVSDASVVMNIYYSVKGQQPLSCYFNGSGLIVDEDPRVGNCIYQPSGRILNHCNYDGYLIVHTVMIVSSTM